jgi:hypothetical protein
LAADPLARLAVEPLARFAPAPLARLAVDPPARLAVDRLARFAVDALARLAGDPLARLAVDPLVRLAWDPLAPLAPLLARELDPPFGRLGARDDELPFRCPFEVGRLLLLERPVLSRSLETAIFKPPICGLACSAGSDFRATPELNIQRLLDGCSTWKAGRWLGAAIAKRARR